MSKDCDLSFCGHGHIKIIRAPRGKNLLLTPYDTPQNMGGTNGGFIIFCLQKNICGND